MKAGAFKLVILLSSILFFSLSVFAADHEDGPQVKAEANLQADILDFFAFPTSDSTRLVLAMTLYSNAPVDAEFSTNVSYRFRLRQAEVAAEGVDDTRRVQLSAGEEEDVIACRAEKADNGEETMRCTLNPVSCGSECLTTEVAVNTKGTENPSGLSLFAGLVRDPFFSDVFRVRRERPRDRGMRVLRPAFNVFENRDALAIVVEVPLTALKLEPGVLATTAETILLDDKQESHAHRIDRMGNVEVTNFLLCFRPVKELFGLTIGINQIDFLCSEDSETVKNSFNSEDAFDVSSDDKDQYERSFTTGLEILDDVDSDPAAEETERLDWPHAESGDVDHPFVDLLADSDWLMVDTSKSCPTEKGTSTYLDIQMAAFLNEAGSHQSCGGRTPNDDVIDTTLTLFINGPKRLPKGWWGSQADGTIRGDGVDQAHTPAPSKFPWLAVK